MNRGVTESVRRDVLPGLELRDGVPAHLRTLVAVPTLLTTRGGVDEQIERLEIHYLASPEGDLHFALLSDWTDAATETVEGDDALLDAAAAGIARLNRRHGPAAGGERFMLFHRRRVWNEGAAAMDRLGAQARQAARAESAAARRDRYDVHRRSAAARRRRRLPASATSSRSTPTRGCRAKRARRLVGKMAHPLNRPRFDAAHAARRRGLRACCSRA